jgi:uncharacterized protein (TIGR03435 family)
MSTDPAALALAVGTSFYWSLLAKVTVLLGGGLLVQRCMSRTRAAAQHMVLAATMVATLAVPCAAWLLSPVTIEVRSAHVEAPGRMSHEGTQPMPEAAPTATTLSRATSGTTVAGLTVMDAFGAAWLLGIAIGVVPLAVSVWRIRQLRREAVPAAHVLLAGWDVARLTGQRHTIDVLLHEAAGVPATCGVFTPFVLLPLDAREWGDGDIRRALLHEFEHIRRRDVLLSMLGRLACAVYWFHPLVWMATRRMHLEAERACDDAVVAHADRADYAAQLVALGARITGHRLVPGVPMAARTPSDLAVRVSAILAEQGPRGRVGRRTALTLAACASLLVLVVSPLRAARALDATVGNAAQSQASASARGDGPSFEVASIKITSPEVTRARDGRVSGGFSVGGRYQVQNYPLRSLIAAAYLRPQINPDFLIAGGPSWIDSARFDIEARAAGEFAPGPDGPSAPRRVMLQKLLAERFGLRTHIEPRDMSIFTLVRVRPSRLGPGLRPAGTCEPSESGRSHNASNPALPCAVSVGPGSVVMRRVPILQLVNLLPRFVNRAVVDNTGLEGPLDVDLTWTPAPGEWVAPPVADVPAPATDGPSLFTALAEQLGLRLVSARGAVDYLIIDDVHLPTEN